MYFNRYVVNYSVIKKPTLRFMSLTILVDVQQTGYTITTLQCFIPLTILVGIQLRHKKMKHNSRFIPLTILVGVQRL